jgi:hypothetical protein
MLKKLVKKITYKKTALDAYRFNIDEVSDKVISGWVHKVGEGNYTASIEIRNNNVILYSIKANLPRKDLQAAAIGSGQYGFVILPSALKLEDDIDSIDIFIDGLKANVNSLPLVLSANIKSNTKTTVAAINKTAPQNNIQMHVDGISTDKVFGWSKKKDSVTHRSLIELKVGNVLLGSDTADKFRQSIKNANIGDGCYCFEINPKVHLFPSTAFSCELYVDGIKVSTKPIQLSVDEKTLENAKFKHEFAGEISGFSDSAHKEIARLSSQINEQGSNTMQVAIENIACLSVRIEVIENILTKHFTGK